jgi:hypothetical protein
MVELIDDRLVFSFPDVHPDARLTVTLQRTLRIPDNGKIYPLPPGLGTFPVRHVDDFSTTVPADWLVHGGVMVPMYQSEALWILFSSHWVGDRQVEYPFAIEVAAGKINAVTGERWTNELSDAPQNYAVAPRQPWLDGFAVEKGVIRQFVAMPLGSGYSAEEQITGAAAHGGLQILVHPMTRIEFDRRYPPRRRQEAAMAAPCAVETVACMASMGLAPGGRMKQEIYADPFGIDAWDRSARGRSFVHLVNSLVWEAMTDSKPPHPPITAALYHAHGLPWFDYYTEGAAALDGAAALKALKSIVEMSRQKGDVALPENQDVPAEPVVVLGPRRRHQVRDGRF